MNKIKILTIFYLIFVLLIHASSSPLLASESQGTKVVPKKDSVSLRDKKSVEGMVFRLWKIVFETQARCA